MKFKQFINESPVLSPKHKKEFENLGSMIKYKDRYKELFGNTDRIYFPVGGGIIVDPHDYDLDIGNAIIKRMDELQDKYTIDLNFYEDYKNNTIRFQPRVSKEYLETIKKQEQLEYSIEEFLDKYGNRVEKEQLKSYPKTGKHDNLMVMISRNPCDIGSMSTGTAWSSCMNLYNGVYNSYTRADVKYGTLIAYLIDADDKTAKKPLGRKLIKPYINYGGELRKELLVLTKPVYGVFSDNAEKVIVEWLNKHQKDIEGYFEIHRSLYIDDDVISIKKEKLGILNRIKGIGK